MGIPDKAGICEDAQRLWELLLIALRTASAQFTQVPATIIRRIPPESTSRSGRRRAREVHHPAKKG
jgi:hypothetical protein